MGFEIERKWVPKETLINTIISKTTPSFIEQGYLCREPVIRVRKEDSNYYLTYKGKGFGCREEYNLPLTKEAYEELLPKHSGIVITKKRYKVAYEELFPEANIGIRGPEGKLFLELDVFEGAHSGLVILEIEFESEKASEEFTAPEEFGTDVTGKIEYVNSFLSLEKSKC